MLIDLHYILPSPPCRAVMILAKQLGIKLNLINVDLFNKEQFSSEFGKINPRKVVPVIVDNGFIISESRAIMAYFVNQYASGHALYPFDANKRAKIDRILYLTAEMFERFKPIIRTVIRYKTWPPTEGVIDNYFELLKVLEQLTSGQEYLAGDSVSIADISFICDLNVLTDVLNVKIDSVTPGIASWAIRIKTALPEYEELITKPSIEFKAILEGMIVKEM